ncbi:hypothetical protein BN109_012 [Yersinia phage phi80-18]|uniref:Uncharacterized protein n=1 Tax=Yersinia phage phi80-18 TaxID=1206559 RepID=I7K3D9_9CAUD|nr:hypothetical protein BN109_012 [Yersinia phage phi80-18]CCI88851.2 hypothetical protein BN109_012 [Yersinia phage phi80-18]
MMAYQFGVFLGWLVLLALAGVGVLVLAGCAAGIKKCYNYIRYDI